VVEFRQAENQLLKERLRAKRIRFTDSEAIPGREAKWRTSAVSRGVARCVAEAHMRACCTLTTLLIQTKPFRCPIVDARVRDIRELVAPTVPHDEFPLSEYLRNAAYGYEHAVADIAGVMRHLTHYLKRR
jgi:hypothetical protein